MIITPTGTNASLASVQDSAVLSTLLVSLHLFVTTTLREALLFSQFYWKGNYSTENVCDLPRVTQLQSHESRQSDSQVLLMTLLP